jgi:hypothetical protein
MFSKKEIPVDYSKLNPDFAMFFDRVLDLENESRKITRSADIQAFEWDTNLSSAKRKVRIVKEDVADIAARVEALKNDFVETVEQFRRMVNKEDFLKLKRLADSWQVENLVSQKEFMKMLEQV